MTAARREAARGFTLVELMVAISGGLFMSVIVFMMARDGSRFYQRESRVADATLASVVGFERLRGDLARASFMASPNVRRDPALCQTIDASWPAGLKHLAGVRISTPAAPNATLSANGLQPDSIDLAGAYDSVDEFPMWGVTDGGTTYSVALQSAIGPLARMGYSAATDQVGLLRQVFKPGRALRIVDRSGRVQYGTIQSVSVTSGVPTVVLSNQPKLTFRTSDATPCGIRLNETGYVNVVNFIRYEVKSLSSSTRFAPLYTNAADVPFEAHRTELVRTELDTSGAPITGDTENTEELVAEYAVDLKFGVTVVNNVTGGTDPALATYLAGNAQIGNYAGDTNALTPPNGPQRIRAIRVRLAVRSREADRQGNISDSSGTFPTGVAPGLYRVGLGAGATAPFARVRTLQADVSLPNQLGVLW
ncbi:MAG: prepilin-type N-terminal cleavage/methylation domain-containing protein [Sorangiineae bacterium]|nr:prepilin-type N-terminal cleavage/methylation domain-containing protein [Polyangiaceae bacterium]MEB2323308.1 prepilin-type N-terminal cleavage/methylation domain-containing protein [Sorangiineae bacterium]